MITLASVKSAFKPHERALGACTRIKRLGRGENNESFLVLTTKGRYVVRIGLKSSLDKNMRREFLLLRRVAGKGVPEAFVFDGSKKFLPCVFEVLEYREGRTTMRWTRRHLRSLAKTVASLHTSMPVQGWGDYARKNRFSLLGALRKWMRDYPVELKDEELGLVYKKLQSELRKKDWLFTSLPSFTIVHGDVCADNVVFSSKGATLIDWEWSSFGDPAQDLGKSFFFGGSIAPWYVGLTWEDVGFFVKEYQQHRKDDTLLERVLLWHDVSSFGDMVFFRWKVNHFDQETAPRPRSYYQRVYKKMLGYYKNKYR